jgi:O-antigen/teichoic acid export membrane protein
LSSLDTLLSIGARFKALVFSIGLFTIINVVAKVSPFLLLPVLTYHLTPSQFGESALFISACSLLVPVIGLRGDAVLISVLGQKSGVLRGDERFCIALSVPWLIASTLMILLGAGMLAGLPIEATLGIPAHWLFVAILTALFSHFFICVNVLWQFNREMKKFAGMQFAQASLVLVATVALIIGPLPEAAGRNIGYALPALVFGAWSLAKLYRLNGGLPRLRPGALQTFGQIALPLLGGTAAHILAGSLDRYAISWHSGTAAVGVYVFGVTLGSVMAVVVEAVDLAWVPYVAKALREPNAAGGLALAGFFVLGVLAVMALVYVLLLPVLINMLARSAAYKDALPVAIATVGAVLCKASFNIFSAPSLYGGRHRLGLLVNLCLAALIPAGILAATAGGSLTAPQFAIGAAYATAALVYLGNLMRMRA